METRQKVLCAVFATINVSNKLEKSRIQWRKGCVIGNRGYSLGEKVYATKQVYQRMHLIDSKIVRCST